MNKISVEASSLHEKSILDSSDDKTSSGCLKRISRKQNQEAATRRSLSRRSSSKSEEKGQIGSFFVKMSGLKPSSEIISRDGFIMREENRLEKRRSPTPVPGYLSRRRQKKRQKINQDSQVQRQLAFAQLQNKYNFEIQKTKMHQRRIDQLEREIKTKIKKIEELSALVEQSIENERLISQKLKQSETHAQQDQQNLAETKTKLQRLKNTIKINRFSQLQAENCKLRKQKEIISKRIAELEQENQQIESRCTLLEKQLLKAKKSQKGQKMFEEHRNQNSSDSIEIALSSKKQYTKKLEDKIAKMEIQLAFLNRKKVEQIRQEQAKKDKQLYRVRSRLAYLCNQVNQYREQNKRLRCEKGKLLDSVCSTRQTLMASSQWGNHDQIFSLSLSPEHHSNQK